MRVFAGLIICALGAAAAAAMPPSDDVLGNITAIRESASIAGQPDADQVNAAAESPDLSQGQPELIAIMDRIERTQRMPVGSAPVANHSRYYAWADAQKTKVTAIFVQSPAPGRRWIGFDDLPAAMGSGCSVVELIFDVKSGMIDSYCVNGG